MKQNHPKGGRFEERLLARLKEVVDERASAPARRESNPLRRWAWRPGRALAGGAIALGIAGAFVLPMAIDGKGNSAYAVTRQSDGSVRVEIREFEDPDGLQKRLTEEGIKVHVDYLPEGKTCDRDFVEEGPVLDHETESDGTTVFTLDPADYRDNSLVIEAEEGGDPIHFYTAAGDVGECEPVDSRFERIDPPHDGDHPEETGGEDIPN